MTPLTLTYETAAIAGVGLIVLGYLLRDRGVLGKRPPPRAAAQAGPPPAASPAGEAAAMPAGAPLADYVDKALAHKQAKDQLLIENETRAAAQAAIDRVLTGVPAPPKGGAP